MNIQSFGHAQSMLRRVATPLGLLALLLVVLFSASAAGAQLPGYTQVSAGDLHNCALREDGTVNCWGANGYGQAKDPGDIYFTQVSAGGSHTCGILKSSGAIHCWGYNFSGQAPNNVEGVFTQVSAGTNHTCALRPDGTIHCWGNNSHGQAEDSQPGMKYTQVSAGDDHTCGLTEEGGVDCWGDDTDLRAQDKIGYFAQMSAGGSHNCAVSAGDGSVMCWGGNGYGQSTPPDGVAFTQVSAGNLHTCGIQTDGKLKCWGYNYYHQLDVPAEIVDPVVQVDTGLGHSCALSKINVADEDGQVWCWGRNDHGQGTVPGPSSPGPTYPFTGFFPPVQPVPTFTAVKAGSAVPLKFSLGGDKGLKVLAEDSPASAQIDCELLTPMSELKPTMPAGGSGLSYDASTGQYTYVWKTEKAWADTCRVLALQLNDLTVHLAVFDLK
jgi:alpha-tubulin suppressor-like RCC1 family protein